ncbi:ABC transporter permease [Micromonospora andamanensis]|uniref:ABC transporter permease n=1 Tax=Micromonospora andamanensis TaxID=1287068 RepID=A0ABQ4HNS8_9ACTN|nr:ABC transporter permease [Micromonospora andamanensis]GIJ07295.1 ABC transporter permease [Micromonospora andamanensis]
MTAPTINGSAFPRGVDDLMPAARQVPVRDGEMVPSRRRLMAGLKVGADKATAIRDRLISEAETNAKNEAYRDLLAQEAAARALRPVADDTAPESTGSPHPSEPAGRQTGATSEQVRVAEDADATDPAPQPTHAGHPDTATPPASAAPVRSAAVWPVVLLALPAFIAIWSGWVGLGELTGFGVVHPLPGIADGFSINTAITLPIGVETYGAYALYVWLSGRVPERARRFAKWSAIASLLVGALGQVAYHLLVAAGVTSAPWWITTAVSCLPVAVLGMGAALAHLVRSHD